MDKRLHFLNDIKDEQSGAPVPIGSRIVCLAASMSSNISRGYGTIASFTHPLLGVDRSTAVRRKVRIT